MSHHDNNLISEACEWAAKIAMGDVGEMEQGHFEAWLDQSPDHVNAYLETSAVLDHPMFVAAIAQAANDAPQDVARVRRKFSILNSLTPWLSQLRAMPFGVPVAGLAAATLLVMLSVSFLQDRSLMPAGEGYQQIVSAEYSTTGVETREISFSDGSIATLGARSAVTVAFSNDERRVTLLKGEGYFAVVSDSSRPFIVVADDTSVRAIGTAFDVRLAGESVRVDVVEGVVNVQSPTLGATGLNATEFSKTAMTAKAGERLIFDPDGGLMRRPTPPYAELAAWRTGRLEYFGEELDRVVADASRYYDGNIIIKSDEIKAMKVTATFPTSSIENIFEVLAEQVPIVVSRTDKGDILLSAREG